MRRKPDCLPTVVVPANILQNSVDIVEGPRLPFEIVGQMKIHTAARIERHTAFRNSIQKHRYSNRMFELKINVYHLTHGTPTFLTPSQHPQWRECFLPSRNVTSEGIGYSKCTRIPHRSELCTVSDSDPSEVTTRRSIRTYFDSSRTE